MVSVNSFVFPAFPLIPDISKGSSCFSSHPGPAVIDSVPSLPGTGPSTSCAASRKRSLLLATSRLVLIFTKFADAREVN